MAGKRGWAGIVGQWPGDESDEEIEEMLQALEGRCVDAELEAEVQELRALRDLVTEAARVTIANAQPHEYPLSVWSHEMPDGHPYTWGATMDTLGERGGSVTPEVIAHALKRLREDEEVGDDE